LQSGSSATVKLIEQREANMKAKQAEKEAGRKLAIKKHYGPLPPSELLQERRDSAADHVSAAWLRTLGSSCAVGLEP
jgi:hypothetical protein